MAARLDLVEHLPAQRMFPRQARIIELADPGHAEPLHQSPGGAVGRYGEAHDAIEVEGRKREIQTGLRRLAGEPLALPARRETPADLHRRREEEFRLHMGQAA